MMTKNLRYDYTGAYYAGEERNAFDVIKELGISYESYKSQPIGQQIIFYGCSNIQGILPCFIDELCQ